MRQAEMYAILVLTIAALVLIAVAFMKFSPAQSTTTTTIAMASTTINTITATAPNFGPCNGYTTNETDSLKTSTGYCSWPGGLMNVTISAGGFPSVMLSLDQINSTTTPYRFNFTTSGCNVTSGAHYIPLGNYRISLTTGAASMPSPCGNVTARLSNA